MRIGLVDLDRTGFPNLALMKLSTWHKNQGDEVLLLDKARPVDKTYASAVFSWNRTAALTIADLGATIGGSGVDLINELPPEIESCRPDYSLYGIDYGMGYLMRGCIWQCDFCVVPEKEGKPRQVATIDDLINRESDRRRPFVVLLDNEFFWKVRWAIDQLEEFTSRGIDYCPSQGLDVRVLTPDLASALAVSPYWNLRHTNRQITFAFDDLRIEAQYRRGVEMLLSAGITPRRLQSFMLVGFNSTIAEDLQRIAIIKEYGIDPFVMVYRDPATAQPTRTPELRNLARWVNRRLHNTVDFSDYWPEQTRRLQMELIPATIGTER